MNRNREKFPYYSSGSPAIHDGNLVFGKILMSGDYVTGGMDFLPCFNKTIKIRTVPGVTKAPNRYLKT